MILKKLDRRNYYEIHVFASDVHGSAFSAGNAGGIQKKKTEKTGTAGRSALSWTRNDLPKEYAPKEVIAMLNQMKNDI